MRKKLLAVMLSFTLAAGLLAGCGKSSSKSSGSDASNNTADSSGNSASAGAPLTESGGGTSYTLGSNVSGSVSGFDTGSLKVEDYMLETGVMRPGSLQRFASVLSRASNGESITIAFIGGSATQGSGASDKEKSYVSLVQKWWDETFPSADIQVVNIGLNGQNSYLAVHRIGKEVLPKEPDLVFIETSLADGNVSDAGEAFECLVKRLLESSHDPAIVPVGLTDKGNSGTGNGLDAQSKQTELAFYYNLPFISMEKVIKNNVADGTWKWTDIAVADDSSDLNDAGHAFLAKLICSYTQRVMDGISSSSYKAYEIPDAKSSKLRYMNGEFLTTENSSGVTVSGFSNFTLPPGGEELAGLTAAWATQSGTAGEFTVTGANIGIVWYKTIDGKGGIFNITIDGTADPYDFSSNGISEDETVTSRTGLDIREFKVVSGENKKHTIKISKNSSSKGDAFYVLGFTVSQ